MKGGNNIKQISGVRHDGNDAFRNRVSKRRSKKKSEKLSRKQNRK